jgi:signal transduction histidine kinase
MVQADPERLASIVAGLLANSGQSSLDGSLIEVHARDASGSVILEVIDQGVGYPQEMLLDAFQHLDAGLSPIAYRIWEARRVALALGGLLTVKTQQGVGSTVRIVLPAASDGG